MNYSLIKKSPIIGCGTFRIVLALSDTLALKIPISLDGFFANEIEFKNYSSLKSEDKKYFAHTIKNEEGLLIQERLYNIRIFERNKRKEEIIGLFKEEIEKENINNILKIRLKLRLTNRLQIGLAENNLWKTYDIENIKLYKRNIKVFDIKNLSVNSWKRYLNLLEEKNINFKEFSYFNYCETKNE
jgi:hypothetical protein